MASTSNTKSLDPKIRSLLGALRWRIRLYVWIEGIALVLVWLGFMFWAGLAIDYLPVQLGANEMPNWACGMLLGVVLLIAGFIFYRWIFRRIMVRFADHSMAVLLERQFEGFHDSLLTVVEMHEHPDHAAQFNSEMLSHTRSDADDFLNKVKLSRIFDFTPLRRSLFGATLVVVSIVCFAFFAPEAFAKWTGRIAISGEKWERRANLEMVGVEVTYVTRLAGRGGKQKIRTEIVPFKDQNVFVSRDTGLKLIVRTDLKREVKPDYCTFSYRTEDNRSGRKTMRRSQTNSKYYRYSCNEEPLDHIDAAIKFTVIGADFRLPQHTITPVYAPIVTEVQLDCMEPKYMDPIRKKIALEPNTQLPVGTAITITMTANKPLSQVLLYDPDTKAPNAPKDSKGKSNPNARRGKLRSDAYKTVELSIDPKDQKTFTYRIPSLKEDGVALQVTLLGKDGVHSEVPYLIEIGAIKDNPPSVRVALDGIGTGVTPNARIPIAGTIQDQYKTKEAWYQLYVERIEKAAGKKPVRKLLKFGKLGNDFRSVPLSIKGMKMGKVNDALDLQELRGAASDPVQLQPSDKIKLRICASDLCDLNEDPNIGCSQDFELDVLSEDQLIARLQVRELEQRRRFEQSIKKMTSVRNYLAEIASPNTKPEETATPDASKKSGTTEKKDAAKKSDKEAAPAMTPEKLVRLVRDLSQDSRSEAGQIEGVALTFEDMVAELKNNRVSSFTACKIRLSDNIAKPLKSLVANDFPELDKRLKKLETILSGGMQEGAADDSIQQVDAILTEMTRVLNSMKKQERFNDLLKAIRALIESQQKVIDQTKQKRREDLGF